MANHAKACLRQENDNDQAHYTKDNLWQEVQQPIPGQDPRVDLQADAVGPRADRWIWELAPSDMQSTKLDAIQKATRRQGRHGVAKGGLTPTKRFTL